MAKSIIDDLSRELDSLCDQRELISKDFLTKKGTIELEKAKLEERVRKEGENIKEIERKLKIAEEKVVSLKKNSMEIQHKIEFLRKDLLKAHEKCQVDGSAELLKLFEIGMTTTLKEISKTGETFKKTEEESTRKLEESISKEADTLEKYKILLAEAEKQLKAAEEEYPKAKMSLGELEKELAENEIHTKLEKELAVLNQQEEIFIKESNFALLSCREKLSAELSKQRELELQEKEELSQLVQGKETTEKEKEISTSPDFDSSSSLITTISPSVSSGDYQEDVLSLGDIHQS